MLQPQITWCAQSSLHYVIEAKVRYEMPLYLAIQLKDYLKQCQFCSNDCVARWVSSLTPQDRIFVKVA